MPFVVQIAVYVCAFLLQTQDCYKNKSMQSSIEKCTKQHHHFRLCAKCRVRETELNAKTPKCSANDRKNYNDEGKTRCTHKNIVGFDFFTDGMSLLLRPYSFAPSLAHFPSLPSLSLSLSRTLSFVVSSQATANSYAAEFSAGFVMYCTLLYTYI